MGAGAADAANADGEAEPPAGDDIGGGSAAEGALVGAGVADTNVRPAGNVSTRLPWV